MQVISVGLMWVLFSFIGSLPFYFLWNAVIPDVFPGLHAIDLMHSWGLFLLIIIVNTVKTGTAVDWPKPEDREENY